jgi:hypothetical protein
VELRARFLENHEGVMKNRSRLLRVARRSIEFDASLIQDDERLTKIHESFVRAGVNPMGRRARFSRERRSIMEERGE